MSSRDQTLSGTAIPRGKIVVENHADDASIAVGAIRISIKTPSGNDPSPTDPLYTSRRINPATGAALEGRAVTTPLRITISPGSTLGVPTVNTPFRIWLPDFEDMDGTLRLGVANCTTGTSVLPLVESVLYTTFAEGGAGGADSAVRIYTDVAVTSLPLRIVGFLDFNSGLATLGTWVKPDEINIFYASLKTPGDQLSYAGGDLTSTASTTTLIPDDNTIPQITEGGLMVSVVDLSIASPCNLIELELIMNCSHTAVGKVAVAVFRNSEADALAVAWGYVPAANAPIQLYFKFSVQVGMPGTITYSFRAGGTVAGTFSMNSANFGGRLTSFLALREIVG